MFLYRRGVSCSCAVSNCESPSEDPSSSLVPQLPQKGGKRIDEHCSNPSRTALNICNNRTSERRSDWVAHALATDSGRCTHSSNFDTTFFTVGDVFGVYTVLNSSSTITGAIEPLNPATHNVNFSLYPVMNNSAYFPVTIYISLFRNIAKPAAEKKSSRI